LLGSSNEEIFKVFLGLSDAEYQDLLNNKVISECKELLNNGVI
jgi:hypothetical protein